ncbi:aldehyde dehydrogenase family protein [Streptomyces tendae]|uniref:aldehyde dehydrogenase family protein n=1 Tax=Streptomyces tendae TaxID=1932 RepID=UPI00341ADA62
MGYALNGSVWGRNGAEARKVAGRLHAGTVNVNEASAAVWGSLDAPMGDSASVAVTAPEGCNKYTEAQTVAHQRLHGFTPPHGIGHEQWARIMTRAFKTLRALGIR